MGYMGYSPYQLVQDFFHQQYVCHISEERNGVPLDLQNAISSRLLLIRVSFVQIVSNTDHLHHWDFCCCAEIVLNSVHPPFSQKYVHITRDHPPSRGD